MTKRLDGDPGDWAGWEWRSDGDLMVNGAYFLPSGQGLNNLYAKDSGAEPKSAAMIDKLTFSAGVLGGPRYRYLLAQADNHYFLLKKLNRHDNNFYQKIGIAGNENTCLCALIQ